MGNSTAWWYPYDGGRLEEIDFGTEGISSVIEMPVRDVRDSHSIGGAFHRTVLSGGMRVRLVLERFSGLTTAGKTLHRQLASLEAHLHRGGLMVFSADRDNAWLGFMEGTLLPIQGTGFLHTAGGNILPQFTGTGVAAALAAGDELVLETPNPTLHREWLLVSSESGGSITLDTSDGQQVRYDYRDQSVAWVRERNFYPALRLPDNQVGKPLLITDHRLTYTWDVTLELDYLAIESLIVGPNLAGHTTDGSLGFPTLDSSPKLDTGPPDRSGWSGGTLGN